MKMLTSLKKSNTFIHPSGVHPQGSFLLENTMSFNVNQPMINIIAPHPHIPSPGTFFVNHLAFMFAFFHSTEL
jgi:hypothetical protein